MENIIAFVGLIVIFAIIGVIIRFANSVKFLLDRIKTLDEAALPQEHLNIRKALLNNCESAQYREQEDVLNTALGPVQDWPSLSDVISTAERDISYRMPWSVPQYDNTVLIRDRKNNEEETLASIEIEMLV